VQCLVADLRGRGGRNPKKSLEGIKTETFRLDTIKDTSSRNPKKSLEGIKTWIGKSCKSISCLVETLRNPWKGLKQCAAWWVANCPSACRNPKKSLEGIKTWKPRWSSWMILRRNPKKSLEGIKTVWFGWASNQAISRNPKKSLEGIKTTAL